MSALVLLSELRPQYSSLMVAHVVDGGSSTKVVNVSEEFATQLGCDAFAC
jgi:hypothetical protein